MRRSILLLCLTVLTVASELHSQRIPVGRQQPRSRERRRSLYERPAISPWIGGDVGFGYPFALCQECDQREGGPAFSGSLAAGLTLFSRYTIAAERSWSSVVFTDPPNSARLTMLTARIAIWRSVAAKAGYGVGRFERSGAAIVDDRPAWLIGGEACDLGRVDGCFLLDYAQTNPGSPTSFNLVNVTYRMYSVRAGFALRFHIRAGHRITLAPR